MKGFEKNIFKLMQNKFFIFETFNLYLVFPKQLIF